MRNSIEKLVPFYRWLFINDNYWKGDAIGYPTKEIYIESKKNQLNVVVKNNGRKSSGDSRKFNDILDARKYMFDYVKQTTLR